MSNDSEELIKARGALGGAIIKGVTEAISVFEKETNISVEQIIINLQDKRVDIHYGDLILKHTKEN